MRSQLSLVPILALGFLACGTGADPIEESYTQSEQPWFSGYGPTRGHEDITRFGVELGNTLIFDELVVPSYFPTVDKGDACLSTSNPLLEGNCITDWPDSEMTTFYGVSSSDFGNHPDLQDLHFMRNFHGGTEAFSGRYACHGARERIFVATERGMEFWSQGDQESALRWFGHATHNLQDSFATCHTTRTGARHETLTDLCTYQIKVAGVCFHETGDLRDRIWQSTTSCTLSTDRAWDCLVSEAQEAAYATAGYLLMLARHIEGGMVGDLRAALLAYFEEDVTNPYAGYYRCDALTNDGYEPAGWEPGTELDAGVDGSADAAEDGPNVGEDVFDPPDGAEEGGMDAGSSGAGGASSDAGTAGSSGTAGEAGSAGMAGMVATAPISEDDGGCSCRVKSTSGNAWGFLFFVAGAWVLRGRIRERSTTARLV